MVDNEDTGKLLLSKGKLKRRCTIIPLSKIKGRNISQDKIQRAKHLVSDHLMAAQYFNHRNLKSFHDIHLLVFRNTFADAFMCLR